MRVLASGTFRAFGTFLCRGLPDCPGFPDGFHSKIHDAFNNVPTMTTLLALHIEAAVDPAETILVCSIALISVSQIMLLLTQSKELPTLARARSVFDKLLAKKNT